MNNTFTRRAALTSMACAGMGLMGCSSQGVAADAPGRQARLVTDAAFQDMVLQAMPNYQLTSALLGRPVVRSPAFSMQAVNQQLSREEQMRQFLDAAGGSGLLPFTLYFLQGFEENFWRVQVPGCQAGRCTDVLPQLQYTAVTKAEHDRYHTVRTGVPDHNVTIQTAELDGVGYEAVLGVSFDYRGQVRKYYVSSAREARNATERNWASRNGRGRLTHPVRLSVYVGNLTLGTDAFYEGAPLARTNSFAGL